MSEKEDDWNGTGIGHGEEEEEEEERIKKSDADQQDRALRTEDLVGKNADEGSSSFSKTKGSAGESDRKEESDESFGGSPAASTNATPVKKVRHTFMRHIRRLQRDLDEKSERIVREVARSGLLEQELMQTKEQLAVSQQELEFLRNDRENARAEIRQLKKNLSAEACEDEDTARVLAKQNDVILGLRATIEELETKSQKDIETIRTLRKDMDNKVEAMRVEWAATLQMVENKQTLQAKTIDSIENALEAEKRGHRKVTERAERALAESARREASCRNQLDTLRALRDLCTEKDQDLDRQKMLVREAEAARRAAESNLRRLQEDACEITDTFERTTRNGELERQLRRSKKKIRALKLSLKKQKRRPERARDVGMVESYRDKDMATYTPPSAGEGLAAVIARGCDGAEEEGELEAEGSFARSFSEALQKLTDEARREQRNMAKLGVTPPRQHRHRQTSSSASRSRGRRRRSRRVETEKRLSSEIAMYFDDSTLEDAFF